jgi:hypothetical protein
MAGLDEVALAISGESNDRRVIGRRQLPRRL